MECQENYDGCTYIDSQLIIFMWWFYKIDPEHFDQVIEYLKTECNATNIHSSTYVKDEYVVNFKTYINYERYKQIAQDYNEPPR